MTRNREQLEERIASLPIWRHQIEVAEGLVTPGLEDTRREWNRLGLPDDLDGARVLDVGCSDGFYSFECEKRGAGEVVAIDDFSSLMNPGRNGFAIAHELLNSGVRFEEMSVYEVPSRFVEKFDLILFLNVIYHLRHPLRALEGLARALDPQGVLYLKSYFHQDFRVKFRGFSWGFDFRKVPKMVFFEEDDLGGDPTNWWGPNRSCLEAMLRSAGFGGVENFSRSGDRLYFRARIT